MRPGKSRVAPKIEPIGRSLFSSCFTFHPIGDALAVSFRSGMFNGGWDVKVVDRLAVRLRYLGRRADGARKMMGRKNVGTQRACVPRRPFSGLSDTDGETTTIVSDGNAVFHFELECWYFLDFTPSPTLGSQPGPSSVCADGSFGMCRVCPVRLSGFIATRTAGNHGGEDHQPFHGTALARPSLRGDLHPLWRQTLDRPDG